MYIRAGGIGPAAPVLAGPVFSQGKSKIPFLQKASNKQIASVILGLIRLIILSYNQGRMEGGFWGFRKPPLTAKQFLKSPTSISIRLLIYYS